MSNVSEQKSAQSVPSINDSLPSGNPSGKTVMLVVGTAALAIFVLMLYMEYFQ